MFTPPQLGDEPFHDPIRLADWVELNLLLEEESSVSVTDVTDQLADTPPDDAEDSERRFAQEDDGQVRLGYWELAEGKAEAAFRELSQREGWLGHHYPLEIDGDVALLRGKIPARAVYQFLVLLRARQLYPSGLGDDGAESGLLFEELMKHALGRYVVSQPAHRVRFGVAGGVRGDGLPQPLHEAVQELSRRMFEKSGQIPNARQGDFKADVVAWKPFGDKRPGQLALIGQATISEGDWMHDEPAKRWTDMRLIRFFARPLTAVAFPETLSLTSPDALDGLMFSSVPFDRLRLLSVLRDKDLPSDMRKRINNWGRSVRGRLPQ